MMFLQSLLHHPRKALFSFAALLILLSVTGLLTAAPALAASSNLPCDIYSAAGTPCVAAHSTVRALYAAYNGSLYQVKRTSDSATLTIGVTSTGGYANSASQDSFCAGTSCTITLIYDQSPQHNNLPISPAGGNGGADVGANASALPVIVGGQKVYGVYVSPGTGYRDLAATGTATNGQPEGMYMVASGTHVNNGCCFDYGNTEQPKANDRGNGHMDAVYFGLRCEHSPCTGSGPWIAADMENGLFQGNGSNTGDQTVNATFVTALLKNNGQNTFALKTGNAQSGGLTTQYNGTLPTGKYNGYIPMHQEGGIVLGLGGDNSNSSAGSFFEGVMTSGYPSDAADTAVQANIVSVGYATNSGSGTEVKIVGQQSGKCVDVQNPNTQPGANVDLSTCNGNLWQNWQLNNLNNGYFTVVSQNSGLCLDVTGGSKSNGGNVEQWTCNGGTNQAWSWTTNGNSHTMKSQNSGLCLDVHGLGTADGTNIQQWTCNGGANQNWSQQ